MKNPPTLKALALVLALAASGSAQATLLTDLFNGGSITAGDKVFDQWTSIFQGTSDGHTVNTNNIDVTALGPIGLDPMNPGPGLSFSILNGEFNVTGDGIYAYTDFTFGFHVSVLNPHLKIKDNSLTMVDAFISYAPDQNNDNGSYILEKVGTAAGLNDLGTKNVEFSLLNDALTSNLTDSAAFAPQNEIWVTKNILVWATDVGDNAGVTNFTQRFSQVPEPGTLLLFVPALAALVGVRRRKTTTA